MIFITWHGSTSTSDDANTISKCRDKNVATLTVSLFCGITVLLLLTIFSFYGKESTSTCIVASLYNTDLRPPRFFLGASSGFGSGFGALTGGGSISLSTFF